MTDLESLNNYIKTEETLLRSVQRNIAELKWREDVLKNNILLAKARKLKLESNENTDIIDITIH